MGRERRREGLVARALARDAHAPHTRTRARAARTAVDHRRPKPYNSSMAGLSQNQRLDAVEVSHRQLHAKLDALAAGRGTSRPALVDAYGHPVSASGAAAAPPPPAHDGTASVLSAILPHIQPSPAPAPMNWMPLLVAIMPALIERLLDRPDPIEQMAAVQALAADMQTDTMPQLMAMAMPALIAKFGPGASAPEETPSGGITSETITSALASLDPSILRQFAGLQAGANGTDSAQ